MAPQLRQRLCLHKLFAIEKEVVELHSKAKEAEAACGCSVFSVKCYAFSVPVLQLHTKAKDAGRAIVHACILPSTHWPVWYR